MAGATHNGEVHDAEVRGRLIEQLRTVDAHSGSHHPSEHAGLTRDQGLGLTLFASCRSMLRGISFLLREDHGEEAKVLMRTFLQDATTLFYIFKNQPTTKEITLRFEYGSLRQERALLQEALKHSPDEETRAAITEAEAQIRQTDAEAKQLNMDLRPLPPMQQMFEELGLPQGYFFFRYASHAVHTSRLALMARMTDHDGRVTIVFGGTPGEVLNVGLFCGELFLAAYQTIAHLLEWETTGEIQRFALEQHRAFLDLRKDAGITTKGFGQSET